MEVELKNVGNFSWLLHTHQEPLFLKPDGVRTRYCIGWNGYGRYIPGTLEVKYNGLPCEINEESNGIWYNFSIAPSSNTNYDDYEVSYITRPLDYAFSIGDELGGYKDEEYFLFPNWNNALGEGDGFWIGKWQASYNNGTPESKAGIVSWVNITRDNAINVCKSKGNGFNLMRNRQWVSIALWTSHHNIHVKGNITGNGNDLDGMGTTSADLNGGTVYGPYLPDTWSHNGKSGGIYNLVGTKWETVDGIDNRAGEIYVYAEDNETYVDLGVNIASSGSGGTIVDISDISQAVLNEGVANSVSTNGFIPTNLDGDYMWSSTSGINMINRSGGTPNYGEYEGLWIFFAANSYTSASNDIGFRISRNLI